MQSFARFLRAMSVDQDTQRLLKAFGFNRIPFLQLRERLVEHGADPAVNYVDGPISPAPPSAITPLPSPDSPAARDAIEAGRDAITAGKVAAIVLNGGMATRFGGVPKGTVPVFQDRSFLFWKITQIEQAGGGKVPVVLMNSFATHTSTVRHLNSIDKHADSFVQYISLRLREDGELFTTSAGSVSLYAPGHGDFPYALYDSGMFGKLRARGVRYVTLSNVDNLGAGLDPLVVGMHIRAGNPMTVELVDREPGDVGGFPAVVKDKVAILEAFRVPPTYDMTTVSVFNTNSFIFDLEALATPPELDWFVVRKQVEGRTAIQFERLVGQLSEYLPVTWLHVPRTGAGSRFLPIKTRDDMQRQQAALEARLNALGVL